MPIPCEEALEHQDAAVTATTTILPPPATAPFAPLAGATAALPLPPPPARVADPARSVRATAHAGGLPIELLMGVDAVPVSVLDVDPGLLLVRRVLPEAAVVERRTLAPPADPRREQRERVRHIVVATAAGAAAAAASVLAVLTAIA